tara:strand:- start:241 stop:543 length:303 start_codon:yes stop_codon:yes gene_type:complete
MLGQIVLFVLAIVIVVKILTAKHKSHLAQRIAEEQTDLARNRREYEQMSNLRMAREEEIGKLDEEIRVLDARLAELKKVLQLQEERNRELATTDDEKVQQ